tara:strand:- start:241545 stop:242129 length:585 start_codon:yes stop_codon:yes gene_type:complete
MDAREALKRMKEGNLRFVAGKSAEIHRTHKLVDNQEPFAIVLGCSDSRVPPEIIFDHGVGDMFCIRVAGNIITPLELGSVEFAALKFGPRLVIVMGHTKCGAVQATVETLQSEIRPELSPGMETIVDFIGQSVDTTASDDHNEIWSNAIKANVHNAVDHLVRESEVVQQLMRDDGMLVVGARYAIETGEVEFFD